MVVTTQKAKEEEGCERRLRLTELMFDRNIVT